MQEILIETIVDNLKIFPFLFVTYWFMEWVEHKTGDKTADLIKKSGKAGPLIGSLLGVLPQCGFSVVAANLYASRLITLGSLIAIFLATSDELLPVLISQNANAALIFKIIGYKFLCGIIFGYLIDMRVRKQHLDLPRSITDLCRQEHCHCAHGILRSALYHSLRIALFIFIITLGFNLCFVYYDQQLQQLSSWMKIPIVGEFISGLIGLIPNCSSSVLLTQFYVKGYINFGTLMCGSLIGSGIGILVLFRVNRPLRENLKIIGTLYGCGLLGGLIANLLEF